MTDHLEILKLIEEVDPKDSVQLDKIDRSVCMWLKSPERRKRIEKGLVGLYSIPKVTRSRDALKEIRPEGWGFDHDVIFDKWKIVGFVTEGFCRDFPCVESPTLPTEELAELHAIIQAIAHERAQKCSI